MSTERIEVEPWPPVVIELQGTPRGKGAARAVYAPGRGVHAYTDAKTRNYESQLRFAAQQAMGDRLPTDEAVRVEIVAAIAPPTSWSKRKTSDALAGLIRPIVKPDCNNLSKSLDALNGIVWIDDKQIVDERVLKVYRAVPFLHICVRLWSKRR